MRKNEAMRFRPATNSTVDDLVAVLPRFVFRG
jgi:hypothetical protein